MNTALQRVALRSLALYLPDPAPERAPLSPHAAASVATLASFGFSLTEEALARFAALSDRNRDDILRTVAEVYRADANWTPLVRDWLTPTGQTPLDMLMAAFCNVIDAEHPGAVPGTRLSCGCLIPDGIFPLSRYTGCPLCGTPFETSAGVNFGGECKLKVLGVFTDDMASALMRSLLEQRTPLDASQASTLSMLLAVFPVPALVEVPMKETMVLAAQALFAADRPAQAARLLRTPADVLRFLWAERTGVPRILRPATLVGMSAASWSHVCPLLDASAEAAEGRARSLHLHYPRSRGRMIAAVLENMDMKPEAMAANMHPNREMWVHMIRALRLTEHARRPRFPRLARLLDIFYNGTYAVPQQGVDTALRQGLIDVAAGLLQKRPGAFARQLFSVMLKEWAVARSFEKTISAFAQCAHQLPTRLLLGLANNADAYFNADPDSLKLVIIATGLPHEIYPNDKIGTTPAEVRAEMYRAVRRVAMNALSRGYAAMPHPELGKIYIAPELFIIPLPAGDRSALVSEVGTVLPGMRLPVEGSKVRMFLHWGLGMKACHLDLDLTALILYPDHREECAFYNLSPTGAQHSGDMRAIPDDVGTAEYIELDLPALRRAGAQQVVFTAECYSGGAMPPGTLVGWMAASSPMTVDAATGVSYDPATVQQLLTLPRSAGWRAITFGMLNVLSGKVTVLAIPGMDQVAGENAAEFAKKALEKLGNKITIGQALKLYAQAQGLEIVDAPADDSLNFADESLQDIPALLQLLLPA